MAVSTSFKIDGIYLPSIPGVLFTGMEASLAEQEGQHPLTGQRAPPISGGT